MKMKNVISIDVIDRERFADNIQHLPAIVNDLRQRQDDSFIDLLTDSFGAFYKYQPVFEKNIDADRQLNQHILQQMMSLNEYKQLRNFTTGDAANSAGALNVVKQIWDKLPASVKQAQQSAESISKLLDKTLDSNEYDPEVLKNIFEQIKDTNDNLTAQINEYDDKIRQVVRAVLAESENDTADGEQAIAMLGWGQNNGATAPTTAEDKLKIAQALKHNRKLQEIMKLAGRMVNIAQKKQRQKVQYIRTEVVGIEQGDELENVIPSEFAYLMHDSPALKTLFMKKLSQGELLQYELDSKEPQAKGPIIVGIDCSGSMEGYSDVWSKACGLAMYSIARMQKRDFGLMLFNTDVIQETFIKKGEHQPQKLLNILSAGTGGGTSFEKPLTWAVKQIKSDVHKHADLVMITDGICDITNDFKARHDTDKKDAEFSTFTILIGGGTTEEKTAKKFSDTVTSLENMIKQNEGQAFNIAFNI
jgi:uncharacterized protein with von Willebrand factor type A (vWA) domain